MGLSAAAAWTLRSTARRLRRAHPCCFACVHAVHVHAPAFEQRAIAATGDIRSGCTDAALGSVTGDVVSVTCGSGRCTCLDGARIVMLMLCAAIAAHGRVAGGM